ncbi:MAG TPA: transglycosylase domain-containing protein, partial [Actinomycetota bacterium]|nr:transglycosylase domain-containing protein [Actinomycetota bacterium]
AQSVKVLDDKGHLIGTIHSDANRISIPLSDIPLDMQHAVIATEDRTFYSNPGISVGGIVRAAFSDVFGRGHQGGSTITQQYVKNAFVGNQPSLLRKAREAIISLKLAHTRSKKAILELYLNTIYFGRGAYGVEAASLTYFGHSAKQLTLPESALLTGIIRAPELYDPAKDLLAAIGRRSIVLDLMARQSFITQAEADAAKKAKVSARVRVIGGIAPHFLALVQEILEQNVAPRNLYRGGVVVRVTLDSDMQRAADDAVHQVYDRKTDPDAALVAIDPHTGAVRAMVGSRDYATRQLNIAVQAHRQPGSAFKPATLTAYLANGGSILDKYKAPATITVNVPPFPPYTLTNYDHAGHGTLTVEQATWESVNTVYAQMIAKAQPFRAVEAAHRLGIATKLNAVPSLALGTSEVSPLELTDMYATFAARGVHHTPYFVVSVTDAKGKVLFSQKPDGQPAIDSNMADTVNQVLQGVIKRGTGTSAQIGRPAAGKTGTTESHRDAWFAGYTPELTAVVWNGYADSFRAMNDVRGIAVVGASFPAQMWRLFMTRALADLPATPFTAPQLTSPSPTITVTTSPTTTPSPTPSTTRIPVPSTPPKPKPKPSQTPTPTPTPTPSAAPT